MIGPIWMRTMALRFGSCCTRNAPHILMGLGTFGSVSALAYAIKSTPAANAALWDAKAEKAAEDLGITPEEAIDRGKYKKLSLPETVKACGKYYIPSIGLEIFSLCCFWFAHGINIHRQAILAGSLSMAEQALVEYQRKVVDMIGEKPEREIRTAIAQDHINQDPPPIGPQNIEEDCWCYYSGYKFRSSYFKLKDIQNEANDEMIKNLYLSESDLLWMFDPDRQYIVPSDESRHIGWCVDNLMEFDILPIMTPDHQPALMVNIRKKGEIGDYKPLPGFTKCL